MMSKSNHPTFRMALPGIGLWGRAPLRLTDLLSLARQRQRLSELDDAALADIGLTRHEADQEASRPAWDVPSHWMR